MFVLVDRMAEQWNIPMNVRALLQERFRQALAGMSVKAENLTSYVEMVRPSQDEKLGDYQANCAMPLAKELNRKPREVADEIVSKLDLGDLLEPPQVAGPGFINLRLKSQWLASQIMAMEGDPRLGVVQAAKPKTFVIDYSSPNVAKPLHVGHLRSTIIGDALKRILQFLGHSVISDNHLGDWGTQFGMLIYGYKEFLDREALAADPIGELVRLYLLVRGLTKGQEDDEGEVQRSPEQEKHYARCLEETAKLQGGDSENLAIWRQFVKWTMDTVEPLYKRLGVQFDHYHGESFYNPMLPGVVASLLEKGIATRSQGAVVIFLKPPAEGEEQPRADAVIQKKDGAFTYMTSDLATIQYRVKQWHPNAILYVVGAPQAQHFQTLFEAVKRWNIASVELEHISFGSVLGNDRKMLSTRNGGAAGLGELLDMAVAHGEAMYEENRKARLERGEDVPDLTSDERRQVAERVGLGAVKYADLSQNRTSDYVFDWKKMLSTDGNSATYMQYAYTRCQGIFRKGGIGVNTLRQSPPNVSLEAPQERALALQILRFEETLHAAAAEFKPNLLTSYLWDLARSYSRFFDNCPVLKAESAELRDSRLVLCDLTARVVRQTLDLLGIETMERM
jgi:arginyl-tRNA synthetase